MNNTCDTNVECLYHIDSGHMELDTFRIIQGKDTVILVEKTDKEFKFLEKLVEEVDYGKNVIVVLIAIFVLISYFKRRNKNG